MDNKKQYCVHCGAENNINDKKCCKCHKKINPKSNFVEYMKKSAKDKTEDKVLDIIKDFIKSHLYGTVLTCSIILTVTSAVVVNSQNNYIEKVSTKPEIVKTSSYAGEGLNSEEIVRKYVEAIRTNDLDTANNLCLENFHPEVREEIVKYAQDNNLVNQYEAPITKHDLLVNGKIYFSDWKDDYFIFVGQNEMNSEGSFGNYNYITLSFQTTYTENDSEIGEYYHYADGTTIISYGEYITDEIMLIEVDGNYYVIGEDLWWGESYGGREWRRQMLEKNNGDVSNVTC